MSERVSRRRLLLGMGMAAVAPLLAACGQAPAPAPTAAPAAKTEAPQPAAKPTEASAAQPATKPAPSTGQVTLRFMRFAGAAWVHDVKFVDEFMQENPNIVVNGEDIVYDEMFKKCLALGATGTLADVFAGHNIWKPYLAFKGLCMDLDPMIKAHSADVKFDDFFPSVIADARGIGTEGKLYWLPTCVHPGGNAIIMFNKNLMNEAGVAMPASKEWTIADYEKIIRSAAKPKQGIFGTDIVVGRHPLYTQQYTRTWGKDPEKGSEDAWLLSRDGKKHQLASPPVKEGIEWYWKLIKDGFVPTRADALGAGLDHFTAGKMISKAGTVGAPANLRPRIADKFELYAVLWPKGPNGHRGSCLSYNTQSAWSKTKYPEEAFKLVNKLTGPEIAFFMGYDGLLHCGARHSAWFNPKLWERFPVMKDAAAWFESGIDPFPQPWNLRFVEWQEAWNQETAEYFDGKEDWNQMFAHTQKRCQEIIDQPRP